MFELGRAARDSYLEKLFYQRLKYLGSVLNSRVKGGPLPTLIRAFFSILSDAVEEAISLFSAYDVVNGSGAAADQARGFFNRPRLLACATEQVFTVVRKDATAALLVPVGATVQTPLLQSGKAYSYSVGASDSLTIAAGVYYSLVTFTSVETGAATSLSAVQELQQVSGLSDCFVVSGAWDLSSANPLSSFNPDTQTFAEWLLDNEAHFVSMFRVQGRDDETDADHLTRCLARWDELSGGATAPYYQGKASNYLDPVSGNAPVALARVSENQTFVASTSKAPLLQPLLDGQLYIMGVEIAVAFRYGIFPAPADLQKIADYLLPFKAQTDKIWVRGPNQVPAGAGAVAVTVRCPSSLQAQIRKVVGSFFVYDSDLVSNYQGLGSTIYKSELIYAVKQISSTIEDVKVVFTLAGKVTSDGDIVLQPFDQIVMAFPDTAITVTVL